MTKTVICLRCASILTLGRQVFRESKERTRSPCCNAGMAEVSATADGLVIEGPAFVELFDEPLPIPSPLTRPSKN